MKLKTETKSENSVRSRQILKVWLVRKKNYAWNAFSSGFNYLKTRISHSSKLAELTEYLAIWYESVNK